MSEEATEADANAAAVAAERVAAAQREYEEGERMRRKGKDNLSVARGPLSVDVFI